MSSLQAHPPLTGLARRLAAEGLLAEAAARRAMAAAAQQGASLSTWLLEQNLIASHPLAQATAAEFGMPLIDLEALDPASFPLNLVDEALIARHQALPLYRRGKRLFVAIADPLQAQALDEIRFHANHAVEPVLAERGQLLRCIEQALGQLRSAMPELAEGELEALNLEAGDGPEPVPDLDAGTSDDAPVVKFVHQILREAIRRGASDIHFEPYENHYRVRLRLDGILREVATPPAPLGPRIAARLKVMAGLDIAERRVPQDGRLKLNLGKHRAVDFRVSSLPTLFGEKLALRILDGAAAQFEIDALGYEEEQKALFLDAIRKPYGMVLATGPTGSGKTVSLYAALKLLNTAERNISTVEDPVEIRVEGINQVQQNSKRGMTFAAALRAFLRQDPDVIMVGEIRDPETAEIAIKAAQTGHMVLSTLHTNDAPQSIARLLNMGIAPYNLTSSVSLVIAQRLARRLCNACKRPQQLPRHALLKEGYGEAEIEAGLSLYEAVGCAECNDGYKGRVGIYQVMPMLEEIQRIVLDGGNALQIAEAARRAGIRDLRAAALSKVGQGVTSLAEIERVIRD